MVALSQELSQEIRTEDVSLLRAFIFHPYVSLFARDALHLTPIGCYARFILRRYSAVSSSACASRACPLTLARSAGVSARMQRCMFAMASV